ncbi:glycosyltransferase family 61 protein [Flavobacteriales bacterium]|nr:glycosyltransferase family 61 protein [Flavobacteriales bacterium]
MSLNSRIKSLFWKIDDSNRGLLYEKAIKPFENFPLKFSDSRVNDAVGYHNNQWFHNEIAVRTSATVEPQYGYAVEGLNNIVGSSIRTRGNLPSPIPMLKAKFLGGRRTLKKAVLIDGSMGINYFHFLSDVLHKIYLLEEHTEIDCPLLIGKQVYSKPFFQFMITNSELSKYDWQVIDQPISVDELYVARPMPYETEYWKRTKHLFIKEDSVPSKRNAIFINRKGTRRILNFDAIKPILEKFGINEVDPENLNINEQADLFNSATHVVGIHGAGMTNVMFSNYENTKVLEICSNNRIGTQYYWLCTALGIHWDMMLGGEADPTQSFELNPKQLETRLIEFFH